MKRLLEIQQKLKAPKNQKNSFWNYNYRSCEDIIEAVKPLLAEQKCVLNLADDLVEKNGRFYVEAIAKIYWEDWKEIMYSVGYAREDENKKGMDLAQITWSASSYARKYALCGLFAIDDWIDSDSTNQWEWKKEEKKEVKKENKKESVQVWPAVINQNELPWFNDKEFEQLKENEDWVKEHDSTEALINSISTKYRISQKMKGQISDFWKNICFNS